MQQKTFVLLVLILAIASFLRLWQLGNVPPSPDWDEAALGYNAYSIMETGRDEYGKFLPIVLRSFDDYKPALYAYLLIPSIKLFGLTLSAVRLPSALLGILTVFASYFLVKLLTKRDGLALLTSFLLAISPWHIQFSRIAFETNGGLALNVFAVLFFLLGLRKPLFLTLAAILIGFNLYMYQSEKVFVPLLALALVFIFSKELLRIQKRYLIAALLFGFVVSLPMAYYIVTSKEALSRAQGVSAFSDQTEFLKRNVVKIADDTNRNDKLGLLLDNRRFVYVESIISGYLSHFDFNWLFIRGDIARHHALRMGLLYLWELPFLLLGMYILTFGNFDKKTKLLLFSWFLLAPIPASITSGVPHAVRTLNFLPTFQVFTAVGLITAFTLIVNSKKQILKIHIKYLIFTLYLLFFLFNLSYYLNQYFVQLNYFYSQDWQYGYEQAVKEVLPIEQKYDHIVVSNVPYMDQSYMFFLFYLHYPPALYQKETQGVSSGGFKEDHTFGKFEFRKIIWDSEERKSPTLFVGRPQDFPTGFSGLIKTINFLDGKQAIVLVER